MFSEEEWRGLSHNWINIVNQLNKTIDDALMKYESIYIQDEPTLLILKEYNQHVPLTFYKI